MSCFHTAASGREEQDLQAGEAQHACQSLDLRIQEWVGRAPRHEPEGGKQIPPRKRIG